MVQEKNIEFINSFEEIEAYIQSHRAINHPLFSYLKNSAKEGFTAKQYQIYRDNYLFRTCYTIPSVTFLVLSAALNFDMETLASAGKNLYEETGSGDYLKTHSSLLQLSHNLHAQTVFGLEPVSLKEIPQSKIILPETRQFVQNEMKLYKNEVYHIVLGAGYAHESAANPMLINFYQSFFYSYKDYYTVEKFNTLIEYFTVHIGGLEERHADEAKQAAKRMSNNQHDLNLIMQGAASFLNSQAYLWDGLYRSLKISENEGNIIPIRKSNEKSKQ